MSMSTRRSERKDVVWLEPLHEELMRPYLELTGSWDAGAFRAGFDPVYTSVVQWDAEEVGMLRLEQKFDCLFLVDILVKPEFQRRGIGTRLVEGLTEKAQREMQPLRLRVPKGSEAQGLFARLGFALKGETVDGRLMERMPDLDAYWEGM